MSIKIKKVYKKFLRGDKISDKELLALREHMHHTQYYLFQLGEAFRLAAIEAIRVYDRTNDYCEARHLPPLVELH